MAGLKKKRFLEKTRALLGATVLDLFRPGWADDIDLDKLDLGDCQVCVLGQLFGGYETGVDTLFAAAESRVTAAGLAGFENTYDVRGRGDISYRKLTTSWKALIRKRQRQAEARA